MHLSNWQIAAIALLHWLPLLLLTAFVLAGLAVLWKTRKPQLWCLHLRGPDEVFAAPSKAAAEEAADYVTRVLDTHPEIRLSPVVVPWPYSAESHADSLIEWPIDWPLPVSRVAVD